jgi:hypothetical protein
MQERVDTVLSSSKENSYVPKKIWGFSSIASFLPAEAKDSRRDESQGSEDTILKPLCVAEGEIQVSVFWFFCFFCFFFVLFFVFFLVLAPGS